MGGSRGTHQELSRDLAEKRRVLEGPDLNTPGLIEQLQARRVRDPVQFKADSIPTGPDAKKLAEGIAEVGDLDPLVAEIEHTRLLADRARRDRDAYVRAHIDSVLDAKRSEAEKQPAAVDAGLDHLRQAIDGYIAFTQDVAGLLATAGRDNRVPGQDEAGDFRRSLKGATSLPTPIVEAD